MSKDKIFRLLKKILFCSVYALLMVINLILLICIISSWWYYFIDYEYWLDNYTLYEWEGYPNIDNQFIFKEALFSLFIMCGAFIGIFLLFKKNKKGIIFLLFPFVVILIRYLLGDLDG